VLVGFMGAGKSTVGGALAKALGLPLVDSDVDLAAARQRTGRTVAAQEGVDELHLWEAEHLLVALRQPQPSVVTAAASVVDDDRCVEALGDAAVTVVWLRAAPATLAARISPLGDDHRRELGDDPEAALRRHGAVADIVVDVDDRTPDEVVDRVLRGLSAGPPTLTT
jgi:shikimate kinase